MMRRLVLSLVLLATTTSNLAGVASATTSFELSPEGAVVVQPRHVPGLEVQELTAAEIETVEAALPDLAPDVERVIFEVLGLGVAMDAFSNESVRGINYHIVPLGNEDIREPILDVAQVREQLGKPGSFVGTLEILGQTPRQLESQDLTTESEPCGDVTVLYLAAQV